MIRHGDDPGGRPRRAHAPLTDRMPKPLIPVAGQSMLDRTMERLGEHGVGDIVVNVHHLGEQIARASRRPRPHRATRSGCSRPAAA